MARSIEPVTRCPVLAAEHWQEASTRVGYRRSHHASQHRSVAGFARSLAGSGGRARWRWDFGEVGGVTVSQCRHWDPACSRIRQPAPIGDRVRYSQRDWQEASTRVGYRRSHHASIMPVSAALSLGPAAEPTCPWACPVQKSGVSPLCGMPRRDPMAGRPTNRSSDEKT